MYLVAKSLESLSGPAVLSKCKNKKLKPPQIFLHMQKASLGILIIKIKVLLKRRSPLSRESFELSTPLV